MGEEKQDEEKKGTKEQNDGGDEKPVPVVLKVDMHCEGCAMKIRKAINRYKGVDTVQFDKNLNMVTVTGNVDPLKLCERVRKKSGRKTELLSPLPKEEIKAEEPKLEKPEPVVVTVVLKVNMHCEGCAQQVKKKILKMKGVQTVDPDFASHKVTVKGTIDPMKLVKYVHRRTGKYAQIVPPPQIEEGKKEAEEVKKEEEKKEEEKKEEKKEEAKPEEGEKKGAEEIGGEVKKEEEKVEGDQKKEEEDKPVKEGESGEEKKEGGEETVVVSSVEEKKNEVCAPRYVIEHVYPPQLFSDENPNACSIM